MRHQRSRLRLTQKPGHSRMLQRNLVTSLLLYENVRTTKKRAKVVQPIVDRLVNYARTKQPQQAIRLINKVVMDKNASRKLMEVYKDRFKTRTSGLTRMVPAGCRKGDGAELVDLQFVVLSTEETDDTPAAPKKAPRTKAAAKTTRPKKASPSVSSDTAPAS